MSINQENKKFIRCEICGTENKSDSVYCNECGAQINEIKKEEVASTPKEIKTEKKKDKAPVNKKNIKKIDPIKLTYLTVTLIVIGGAILYSSGIFDDPVSTTVQHNHEQPVDDFHRGVDMSKLQEINNLRESVTNNPADHQSMLHLAHLLNDSGFKEEAIKWYRQYLKDHGDEADVWVDMGVCYFDLNDFENAVSSMRKGIELEPNHQIAHFNLGIVTYTKGNINEAVQWWNKAIEINPTSDIANRAKELIKNNTNM